jgi:hypothetical protein
MKTDDSIYYTTYRCPECGSSDPSPLFVGQYPLCNACLAGFLAANVPTMEITGRKAIRQQQLVILKQGTNEEEVD